ncbi:MAG: copper-binding protein [Candidatus Odyssella sp.]|nr:copper-binding protein [Candidatus Odyssella sp.]
MKTGTIAAVLAVSFFSMPASAQGALVDGQVQKIDTAQGKVTLRHGPIKKFDMDSMTMVFRIQDPSQLQGLKPGDKVKFEADRVNGQFTIIKIEKAK